MGILKKSNMKLPRGVELIEDLDGAFVVQKGSLNMSVKFTGTQHWKRYHSKITRDGVILDTNMGYCPDDLTPLFTNFSMYRERTSQNSTMVDLLESVGQSTTWTRLPGTSGTIRRYLHRDCVRAYICTPFVSYFIIKSATKFLGIEYVICFGHIGFNVVSVDMATRMIKEYSQESHKIKLLDKQLESELVSERI